MSLQAHYLRLYRAADEILKAPGNPCAIRVVDGKATCVMSRQNPKMWPPGTLCCTGCEHLGPNGCTVEALSCKLGWCYTNCAQIEDMGFEDHPAFAAIAAIRREAWTLGVPLSWRKSLEQTFAER